MGDTDDGRGESRLKGQRGWQDGAYGGNSVPTRQDTKWTV